jgi:Alr-MurF fusion protein
LYSILKINEIIGGRLSAYHDESVIRHLVYDSRRIQYPADSLFFAIVTDHNDGHKFLSDAFKKGTRNFVVSKELSFAPEGANIIMVPDVLQALQDLAAFHRSGFDIPVIAITGSNGKTIVKEWLFQVLQVEKKIVRSPRSYNSQIGVPFSVWQMEQGCELAIFEAGISQPGEMEQLQKIIRPSIGLLTNIGTAHDDGFSNDHRLKLEEKIRLFSNADIVITRGKDGVKKYGGKFLSWGEGQANDFVVSGIERTSVSTGFTITYKEEKPEVIIPFTDEASFENAVSCCCILLVLGYGAPFIEKKMAQLHVIDMRLQLKHGVNNSVIINDSYSADIDSLRIALDFMQQHSSGMEGVAILSDFAGSGRSGKELYKDVAILLDAFHIRKLYAIGNEIYEGMQNQGKFQLLNFATTDEFLQHSRISDFNHEIILIKGARKFEFERIAGWLEQKLHQTVLEIDLDALVHNLKQFKQALDPGVKIMAMVKAFSYGSGAAEISGVLQFHNVDYLGVAYADEGADLVRSGITLPIMVMNAELSSFQSIVDHDLQPVIFSFSILHAFEDYIRQQGLKEYPVHIEIETGMNRLGFSPVEIQQLALELSQSDLLKVQSVFTHLAASEDPGQDDFTLMQQQAFQRSVEILSSNLSYNFIKHISNSAGIIRHASLQMDMVRLGIGLYGIEPSGERGKDLRPVARLRSTIAQIRKVGAGASVSYNRRGLVEKDSIIGTVRIGYADGYSRQFSNGAGRMLVKGQLAPVIGSVCMDMTMIDLSSIEGVKEGDEVIIFGPELPVQEVAGWINTIPYEIMAGISQRVKRVYYHE